MGRPKGLLEVAGRPILEYLLERLDWSGPTLLVTAPGREHPPAADAFDREVTDPVAGEGPLRGIQTALEHATTEYVVVVVVDMPAVMRGQLEWLIDRLAEAPAVAAMMTRRGGEIEPFPCVYRREQALPLVREQLAAKRRAVNALARLPDVDVISAPADWPEACWTNLNEQADLESFTSHLTRTETP